nr:LXG domain-containing protein [Priestia megaterium]
MKTLDIQELNHYIDRLRTKLTTVQQQMNDIRQAVHQLTSLDHALQGNMGTAIRSFFADVHEPFLQYLDNFLTEYDQALIQLKEAVHSYEPAADGLVQQSFLENDLEHGLQRVEDVTKGITDEVNHEIYKIQDIISLPLLDDHDLLRGIQQAKNNKNEVIEQLYALDRSQMNTLEPLLQELTVMKNYMANIKDVFYLESNSISTYDGSTLKNSSPYDEVIKEVHPPNDQ